MFRRKSATQTKNLLHYLASAQQEQQLKSKRLIAQTAAVDEKNADLSTAIQELENLLKGALAQDAYIDLDSLKKTPGIPAFSRTKPELRSYLPEPPSNFMLLFPRKKKAYDRQCESAKSRYKKDRQDYDAALNHYQKQVERMRAEADVHNQEIERYKQDFAAGEPTEIENYFTLVLDNSAYPAGFPKQAQVAFAAESKELRIEFALPAIDVIPATKSYAYDMIRDEITQTVMPQKRRRSFYASMLAQISLRTLHEVFTADRMNKIDCVDFAGYVDGINPSSGQPGQFCLVALSVRRPQFDSLDLRQVEPRACLKGLNGRLSSKPDLLLAVAPMTRDEPKDASVSDAAAIPYSKQRISELQNELRAREAQITELESKFAAQGDEYREFASTLRDKQAVIVDLGRKIEAQRGRLAELVPALREEQERNAELSDAYDKQKNYIAELESAIQAQKEAIAALESQPTEEPDDTQPIESAAEMTAESDFDAAGIFAPIGSGTAEDGAGGALIPARDPGAQARSGIAQNLDHLEVMSVFVKAQSRYVDYIGEGLPKKQINRLVREGRLERHRFHTYKLRATLAGIKWYRERSHLQEPPKPEPASHSPEVRHEAEKTITLGELLGSEVDAPEDADSQPNEPAQTDNKAVGLLERPAGTPDDLLTDLNELVTIMGDYGSETSRLIETMVAYNWVCSHDALEAAFRMDENVTFVSIIIDEINDRANEKVEHPLIIEENDQWVIDEEFRDEIEHILKHSGYLNNSHND